MWKYYSHYSSHTVLISDHILSCCNALSKVSVQYQDYVLSKLLFLFSYILILRRYCDGVRITELNKRPLPWMGWKSYWKKNCDCAKKSILRFWRIYIFSEFLNTEKWLLECRISVYFAFIYVYKYLPLCRILTARWVFLHVRFYKFYVSQAGVRRMLWHVGVSMKRTGKHVFAEIWFFDTSHRWVLNNVSMDTSMEGRLLENSSLRWK
jgi:hypothetical protein